MKLWFFQRPLSYLQERQEFVFVRKSKVSFLGIFFPEMYEDEYFLGSWKC